MIRIFVPNKGNIRLSDDAKINLVLNNPIFADGDFIPGDYSLPFDFPGGESAPENANILDHPDIPYNHKNRFEIKDVELLLDDNVFRKGTVIVDSVTPSAFSANFRWGMKNIRDDFKNYRIRDLVDEQITITAETQYKKVVISWGGAALAEYEIVINGTSFKNTSLVLLAIDINNDSELSATFVDTGDTYGISGDRIEVEPTADPTDPETEFTVDWPAGINTAGWSITSNPFTAFYGDYADFIDEYYADPPKDYIKYPVLWNLHPPVGPFSINEPTATGYNFGRLTGLPRKGAAFAPFMHLSHVFDEITTEFGVHFTGDFFTDPEFAKALFYHNYPFHKDVKYIKGEEYRFFDAVINLRNTVPDITIETLLKELQKKFNLAIIWKESISTLEIRYRKPLMLAKNYVDWTSLVGNPTNIDYTQTANGYELTAASDENDLYDTEDAYIYADGSETIQSVFGSIKQDYTILGLTGPAVKQPMDGKFIPKLIFYKGINTAGAVHYQEASRKGMEVDFSGTGALGESQWIDYLRFLCNRKVVTFLAQLEYRHLNVIDWTKKIRIEGDDYFIKSINTTITTKGVKPSKVELYRV